MPHPRRHPYKRVETRVPHLAMASIDLNPPSGQFLSFF